MLIFRTKKDIAAYVASCPEVVELRKTCERAELKEIKEELVKLIATGDGSPDFGEDWEVWLNENLSGLLEEAVSIVA